MRRLLPHLQRVLQVHSRNESLRGLCRAEEIALDSLDTGVVAVDEQGRILWANESADRVLEKGLGVSRRQGRLVAKYFSEAPPRSR